MTAKRISIFPLSGAILLPDMQLPLHIFEPRYLAMIEDAMSSDRLIGMIQPEPDFEKEDRPPLLKVGCAGRITAIWR